MSQRTIIGKLVDATRSPLAGVPVIIRPVIPQAGLPYPADGELVVPHHHHLTTGDDGTFTLAGLLTTDNGPFDGGVYELRFQHGLVDALVLFVVPTGPGPAQLADVIVSAEAPGIYVVESAAMAAAADAAASATAAAGSASQAATSADQLAGHGTTTTVSLTAEYEVPNTEATLGNLTASVTVGATANRFAVDVHLDMEWRTAEASIVVARLFVNGTAETAELVGAGGLVRMPMHGRYYVTGLPVGACQFQVRVAKIGSAASALFAGATHSYIHVERIA